MSARPEITVHAPPTFVAENAPALTRVFVLTHTDSRDYYQTHVTNLGVFSTRAKALAAQGGEQAAGRLDGVLVEGGSGAEGCEVWFDIEEVVVDAEGSS